MPVRNVSASLLLVLGMWAARSTLPPTPSAAELRGRGEARALTGLMYGTSEKLCEIDSADVCESSGLALCATNPQLLWTHNDSGGAPAIVAFDRQGKIHGIVKIAGATNRDWEDMTSFRHEGEPWLILADSGNNFGENRPATLYFVREPTPGAREVRCDFRIDVQFETGPRDCEALAVDQRSQTILFISKVSFGRCEIFELPLPDLSRKNRGETEPLVAIKIAAPELTHATGMCISSDGERIVIVNYQCGFEFVRRPSETWRTALARPPRKIALSWRMPQREAVCFDLDDRSLLMTSEARQGFLRSLVGANVNFSIPLWRVPARLPDVQANP
jgi:hypothetical protein